MNKRISIFIIMASFLGLSLFWVDQPFSESETILAKVGEEVITQKDFEEFINSYRATQKEKSITVEEKRMLLDNLIIGFLISREAEKEKMDQKPEVISKLKLARKNILSQEYINTKINPFIHVTDQEIDEKFKENPNLLPKEAISLREILVKTEQEAEAIYEEIKKGGDFSKLASEKSLAPSNKKGGLRTLTSKGQMPKALEEVAFNLKKGELSKPIKTDEGYYLLYLVDRKERTPEELQRYEKIIKEKIKTIEIAKKTQEMMVNKAKELRKNTAIEAYYDRIK